MPGIALNEDNSNFLYSFPPEKMTVAGVREHAEFYACGQVDRIIFNANAQRASFDSQIIDPIWRDVEFTADGRVLCLGEDITANRGVGWIRNAKLLFEHGIDPYRVWLETARANGREAWISCRMNDLHDAHNPKSFMHDTFWRKNTQFRISPGQNGWYGEALDYAHPEVRQYRLALLQEYLDRYDLDGLELDFSRFPILFKRDGVTAGTPLMNGFMRQVRKMVDSAAVAKGHPIKLAVRVPSQPQEAMNLGTDVKTWCAERLVDCVTVTNFWPNTDSDMPLERWREITGPAVELDAGLELWARAYPNGAKIFATADIDAGFAAQYLYRGADRIYLFNHMRGYTSMKDSDEFHTVMHTCGAVETAYPLRRRHILASSTGVCNYPGVYTPLPCPLDAQMRERKINVGGGTANRRASVVFGLDTATPPAMSVEINGKTCGRILAAPGDSIPDDVQSACAFEIPQNALTDGENTVSFRASAPANILWLEITIERAD